MKYNSSLTVEEAAKIVTGLNPYLSLFKSEHLSSPEHALEGGRDISLNELVVLVDEAVSIMQGLMREATIFVMNSYNGNETILKQDIPFKYFYAGKSNDENDLTYILDNRFTRESIANWFIERGEPEMAKRIYPKIDLIAISDTKKSLTIQNNQLELKEIKKEAEKKPTQTRGNDKPYRLIGQLIKIIDENANFKEYSKLHSYLERQLKGDEELAVSPSTLKAYLEKIE
jgi:hypothetical protein